jgi:hypothetical protein
MLMGSMRSVLELVKLTEESYSHAMHFLNERKLHVAQKPNMQKGSA